MAKKASKRSNHLSTRCTSVHDHHANAAAFAMKLDFATEHINAGGATVHDVEFNVYPNPESLTFTAFTLYREHHASRKAKRRTAGRHLALSPAEINELDDVRYEPLVALA